MIRTAFFVCVLATIAVLAFAYTAVITITRANAREVKLMNKLGWLYHMPDAELEELKNTHLILKWRDRFATSDFIKKYFK